MKAALALVASGLALATLDTAAAADLAARPYVKAPAAIASVYNWTGVYGGANAGYAWGQSDLGTGLDLTSSWAAETPAFRDQFVALSNRRLKPAGAIGGLQIGSNWQTGAWVLGLEADANASDLGARTIFTGANPPTTRTFNETIRNDWLVTVRGRAGYAVDRTLLYITGGLAVGDVKGSWDLASGNGYTKTASISETKAG